MKREIKFRAWNKNKSEMTELNEQWICYEYSSLCFGNEDFGICDWGEGDKEDYEIMQFTGLKDKNGKEIYEDDIIQFDFGTDSKEGAINTLVVFESGMFCYYGYKSKQVKKGKKWHHEHDYCHSRWWVADKHPLRVGYYGVGDCKDYENSKLIEVIGNIHENPELL